jgi:uncharacterized protein DUF4149
VRPLLVLAVAALWLGGALLLAVSVAPAAFATLPSRSLAGALVGRVLPVLFDAGLVAGAAVALAEWLGAPAPWSRARMVSALAWAAACAVAQLGVAPSIGRLRATMGGPVDALAASDPRRIAFGRLHGASVGLLGLGMLAAAVVATLAALAARPRAVS